MERAKLKKQKKTIQGKTEVKTPLPRTPLSPPPRHSSLVIPSPRAPPSFLFLSLFFPLKNKIQAQLFPLTHVHTHTLSLLLTFALLAANGSRTFHVRDRSIRSTYKSSVSFGFVYIYIYIYMYVCIYADTQK